LPTDQQSDNGEKVKRKVKSNLPSHAVLLIPDPDQGEEPAPIREICGLTLAFHPMLLGSRNARFGPWTHKHYSSRPDRIITGRRRILLGARSSPSLKTVSHRDTLTTPTRSKNSARGCPTPEGDPGFQAINFSSFSRLARRAKRVSRKIPSEPGVLPIDIHVIKVPGKGGQKREMKRGKPNFTGLGSQTLQSPLSSRPALIPPI
jgi:hypothetical protein